MSRLLSPPRAFIFMEGGDNNATALKNFLTAQCERHCGLGLRRRAAVYQLGSESGY